jgi:hypothetical protein
MSAPNKILNSIAWICLCGAAGAQQPPPSAPANPKSTAQSEAGEPRADTSNSAAAEPAGAPTATHPAAVAPEPAPAPTAGRTPSGHGTPAPARAAAAKIDRLELGTATVTGDREQPKVMYIVPWKKSDIGDLTAKPMNSLVDEILAPVDRDVFKREVIYYRAVEATASQNGAPPKPAQQGEK